MRGTGEAPRFGLHASGLPRALFVSGWCGGAGLLALVLATLPACYLAHGRSAPDRRVDADASRVDSGAPRLPADGGNGIDALPGVLDAAGHEPDAARSALEVPVWAAQRGGRLFGLDLSGSVIVELEIPAAGRGLPEAHGLAVDDRGQVHVLTGGIDGYLSSFDPRTEEWSHRTHPGLGTWGLLGGGVAVARGDAFVTDMDLPHARLTGLIRFPLSGARSTRIDGTSWPDPLAVASSRTGRVWILTAAQDVLSLEPDSGTVVHEFEMPNIGATRISASGIATIPDGSLLFASNDSGLVRVSREGRVIRRLSRRTHPSVPDGILSVDAHPDGRVVASGRDGVILFTTTELASVAHVAHLPRREWTRVAFNPNLVR